MKTKQNLRSAVEATVRAIKHPFPKGKLPVRGRFRIFSMLIGAATMNNVRQIQRHLARQIRSKTQSKGKNPSNDSFLFLLGAGFGPFGVPIWLQSVAKVSFCRGVFFFAKQFP
jgi:hypothetical protein